MYLLRQSTLKEWHRVINAFSCILAQVKFVKFKKQSFIPFALALTRSWCEGEVQLLNSLKKNERRTFWIYCVTASDKPSLMQVLLQLLHSIKKKWECLYDIPFINKILCETSIYPFFRLLYERAFLGLLRGLLGQWQFDSRR